MEGPKKKNPETVSTDEVEEDDESFDKEWFEEETDRSLHEDRLKQEIDFVLLRYFPAIVDKFKQI